MYAETSCIDFKYPEHSLKIWHIPLNPLDPYNLKQYSIVLNTLVYRFFNQLRVRKKEKVRTENCEAFRERLLFIFSFLCTVGLFESLWSSTKGATAHTQKSVLEMAIRRSLDRDDEKKGFGSVYVFIRLIWLI